MFNPINTTATLAKLHFNISIIHIFLMGYEIAIKIIDPEILFFTICSTILSLITYSFLTVRKNVYCFKGYSDM